MFRLCQILPRTKLMPGKNIYGPISCFKFIIFEQKSFSSSPVNFSKNDNDSRKKPFRPNRSLTRRSSGKDPDLDRVNEIKSNILRRYIFSKVCLNIENMSSDVDSLDLLFFPSACIEREKIENFVSEWWQNWWAMIETRLKFVELIFIAEIYYPLYKIDRLTEGKFMKLFGWENFQILADRALNEVEYVKASTLSLILSLAVSAVTTAKETPFEWLNTKLLNSLELWFYVNCVKSHVIFYMANKNIGRILSSLANLKLEIPSDICLYYLTKICVNSCRQDKQTDELLRADLFNLHKMAKAFLDWNINPELYYKGFWLKWYKKMDNLQERGIIYSKQKLTAYIMLDYYLIMIKFDCEKEFAASKEQWARLMKFNVSYLKPSDVRNMIEAGEKKYAENRELFVELVPTDVLYVLNKRAEENE